MNDEQLIESQEYKLQCRRASGGIEHLTRDERISILTLRLDRAYREFVANPNAGNYARLDDVMCAYQNDVRNVKP